jgi:hypothetical protein
VKFDYCRAANADPIAILQLTFKLNRYVADCRAIAAAEIRYKETVAALSNLSVVTRNVCVIFKTNGVVQRATDGNHIVADFTLSLGLTGLKNDK